MRFHPFTPTLVLLVAAGAAAAQGKPYFVQLGVPEGNYCGSTTWGVSADGRMVAVMSGVCGLPFISHAFRWTEEHGWLPLDGQSDTIYSDARAIAWNGRAIVGQTNASGYDEAYVWTEALGVVSIGDLAGGSHISFATGVSGDGRVVVGTGNGADGQAHAFRWAADEGMVDLGVLPGGGNSNAGAISADGRVIVGNSFVWDVGHEAFRWTEEDGMVSIGDLPGGPVVAFCTGVTPHGDVIVGYSNSDKGVEAFRWTEDNGMVGLGWIHDFSVATSVSADGRVVVGETLGDIGRHRAFIWTPTEGMRDLQQLITDDLGLSIGTMDDLIRARGVSADGRTIVGWGYNLDGVPEAWLVYLGSACRVDFDGNGSIDTADVLAFLGAWGNRDLLTDWNYDAAVNTRDIVAFLNEWVAKCP